MRPKPRQLWFSPAELAALYGVSAKSVVNWITKGLGGGRLKARRVGRCWRVRRRDWRAWLRWCRGGGPAEEPRARAGEFAAATARLKARGLL